jgi:hypothetical protein
MRFRIDMLLATSLILTGCASGHTKFNSKVFDKDTISAPKKILLYTNMSSEYFRKETLNGFQSNLQSELKACGIESRMHEHDPINLEEKELQQKLLSEFQPDTVGIIRRAGGNVTVNSSGGGAHGNLYFEVTLRNQNTKKSIWLSKFDYSMLTGNMFVDDKKSGESLGKSFTNQLKKDGILSNCPLVTKASQM